MGSGVPPISVHGLWSFLYCINDLPARLGSRVRIFSNDNISYLVIILLKDTEALQYDELAIWESK